mmetsp:Transcript_23265/g.32260  ORF Transcript_23265/g.32260 Transcript_23265/m.32260 type:complete len:105 (-) Transcript_23265:90-404(-)
MMRKSIVITCSIQEVPAGFSLQNSNSKVYLVVFFKLRGAVTNICMKMKSILLLLFVCCCIIIIIVLLLREKKKEEEQSGEEEEGTNIPFPAFPFQSLLFCSIAC